MKDYFKPCYSGWFYTPCSFFGNIKATFKWIKWFFQRGSRGWADCDWWNMDGYLVEIILAMLRKLKESNCGYPADLTEEKWDTMLGEMIEGFEAADRVIDDDYYEIISPEFPEKKATRAEVLAWGRASRKDQRLFKKKVKLFTDRFFNLWD